KRKPKPLTPDRDHRRYNPLTAQHHLPDRSRSPKRLITIAEIRIPPAEAEANYYRQLRNTADAPALT
ncbi:hypothetical protein EHZ19_32085, partial [Paraburkholderia bannensis]